MITGHWNVPALAHQVQIEMIFDLNCPWCYIGKRHLERALAMRPAIPVVLRWWPFLLTPDMPKEGVDRLTFLLRKFGSETRISRIYDAIARVGQSVAIDFSLDRIQRAPNTVDAHRLVRFAERHGLAQLAVESIFRSFFVAGRDIGDRRELLRIGAEIGLDSTALLTYLRSDTDYALIFKENARAHRLGINGVPSFVFNGSHIICGAQESIVLARMLDVTSCAAAEAESGRV